MSVEFRKPPPKSEFGLRPPNVPIVSPTVDFRSFPSNTFTFQRNRRTRAINSTWREVPVIVEDALVLGVDEPGGDPNNARILTLLLAPAEILKVRLAQESGTLSVAPQPVSEEKR